MEVRKEEEFLLGAVTGQHRAFTPCQEGNRGRGAATKIGCSLPTNGIRNPENPSKEGSDPPTDGIKTYQKPEQMWCVTESQS